ncbi:S-adenosyl-L-methionine-dependent methyltransferase [Mycena maculata]|uniref:S-adenosyl-L-methionine-dependent methyltransferase n=1 Tax=Mycena maculata TaxID=230809 RepID=A0AAD7JY21_9AGAR|nr:S-adenosyl-L-methionine-dependent methyltransferase [Mycena maculata]
MHAEQQDSRDHTLKDVHGRGMNILSEEYKLPADRAEMDRLSIQHRMWRLLVGGLYPPALKDTIDKVLEDPQSTILDAGCGPAIWSIEMAQMYPGVHVVGVDLARNFHERPPSNFEFIQMDLSPGLPPCRNTRGYDLIHARSLVGHLKDPKAFIRQAHGALRTGATYRRSACATPTHDQRVTPGGIFILGDLGKKIYDRDKKELPPRFPPGTTGSEPDNASWFVGWQQIWLGILGPGVQSVDAYLEDSPFSSVSSRRYFAPIGWKGDLEDGAELGEITLKNSLQWARAAVPAVLASGKYDRQVIDFWLDAIEAECVSKQMYLAWDLALSVKAPESDGIV